VAAVLKTEVISVWEAVVGISLPYLPIKVANTLLMDVCDQAQHRLPKIQDQTSLVRHGCTFQEGAGTMPGWLLPIKTNNMIVMNNHYQITR
jgi:hypothetical protein